MSLTQLPPLQPIIYPFPSPFVGVCLGVLDRRVRGHMLCCNDGDIRYLFAKFYIQSH